MESSVQGKNSERFLNIADIVLNWSRQYSLWPMFFGLSCCFVEEAAVFTSRYDLARFGAEVLRPSPRQADLLIVSGTVFKKIAPIVLRLYEQMPEPKWVISMGSCSNSGGMFDVYSVVQGVDQIIPVDVYVPGCPPRPEALMQGLVILQNKIVSEEKPSRRIFHLGGGSQGTETPVLVEGVTKSGNSRGPGFEGLPVRGKSVTAAPPPYWGSRSDTMWTPPASRIELESRDLSLAAVLRERFGDDVSREPHTSDMMCFHVKERRLGEVLRFLKDESRPRYQRLDDLTAVDESKRRRRVWAGSYAEAISDTGAALHYGQMGNRPYPDYTLVYHLLSFDAASRLRIKCGLTGKDPVTRSITDIWPSANFYEREVFDMFGIRFNGHPNLRRILMPHYWTGHPLRKDYPGRATQMPPYTCVDARRDQPLDAREVMSRDHKLPSGEHEFFLNIGPHHVSTHGLLRCVASLDGEEITGLDVEIGYHHRATEKLGERQSWHQYIPYTNRNDYLAGSSNEIPYLSAVETLAGIKVP